MTAAPLDLDTIGAAIERPDPRAEARALGELGIDSAGVDHAGRGHGRLAELAAWWAAVQADPHAPAPTRVAHLAGPGEVTAVEGASVLAPPVDASVETALAWGVATGDRLADEGTQLLAVTLVQPVEARLATAELMGLDAIEAACWPTVRRIDDDAWMTEVLALRDGLAATHGRRGNLTDLLQVIGNPALAGTAALLVQLALRQVPALIDGFSSAAAALIARRTSYGAAHWWRVVDAGDDPLQARILASLTLEPLLNLRLSATDGVGAQIGLDLLRRAATLLQPGTGGA